MAPTNGDVCRNVPCRRKPYRRGICWPCYQDRAIRARFPSISKMGQRYQPEDGALVRQLSPETKRQIDRLEIGDCGCPKFLPCDYFERLRAELAEKEEDLAWLSYRSDPDWDDDDSEEDFQDWSDCQTRIKELKRSLKKPHRQPCDCPLQALPACSHVLARIHALTLAEWTELLASVYPGQYVEPLQPEAPSLAVTRQARVQEMVNRWSKDGRLARQLRRPDDLWMQSCPQLAGAREKKMSLFESLVFLGGRLRG